MPSRFQKTLPKILSVLMVFVIAAGCYLSTPAAKPTETGSNLPAQATPTASSPAVTLPPTPTLALSPTATEIPPAPTSAPADVWILFLNNGHIHLANGDGSQKRLLTNAVQLDTYPTWSPDGQKIAYLRIGTQEDTLYVMNADGSDLHSVGKFTQPIKSIDIAPYYWLSDSQTILISSSDQAFWLSDVLLVNASNGQTEKIATSAIEAPVLSPDQNQVAMILTQEKQSCEGKGCTNPGDIYRYDLQTKQLVRLTKDNTPIFGLRWSPDGNLLAFHSGDDYENTFFIHPDGTPAGQAQQAPWWAQSWSLSPDQKRVAFAKENQVFVAPLDGSNPVQVTHLDPLQDGSPTIYTIQWAPDGRSVIFYRWTKIYIAQSDGSAERGLPLETNNVYISVRPVGGSYPPPPDTSESPAYEACPGAPLSRLKPGDQARVSISPPLPNNVRAKPNKNAKLLGKIQPGETVFILSGPKCNNNWVWWEIRSDASGLTGWTPEGDPDAYWLEPLP